MRKLIFGSVAALCCAVSLGLTAAGAFAQEGGNDTNTSYWLGRSKGAGPTCAMIDWNVVPPPRDKAGPIKGVAFYSDMSGISRISGNVTADGKITSTLTSVFGNGPVGTVTGTRAADSTHLDVKGDACANASFTIRRWSEATGGGG